MMNASEHGALPLGFVWGAVRAGIKASGNLDVALAVAAKGTNGAAVFTAQPGGSSAGGVRAAGTLRRREAA